MVVKDMVGKDMVGSVPTVTFPRSTPDQCQFRLTVSIDLAKGLFSGFREQAIFRVW
jgi:hypothetical protein